MIKLSSPHISLLKLITSCQTLKPFSTLSPLVGDHVHSSYTSLVHKQYPFTYLIFLLSKLSYFIIKKNTIKVHYHYYCDWTSNGLVPHFALYHFLKNWEAASFCTEYKSNPSAFVLQTTNTIMIINPLSCPMLDLAVWFPWNPRKICERFPKEV